MALYMIMLKNDLGKYEPAGIGSIQDAVKAYWDSGRACRCVRISKLKGGLNG